VTIEDILGYHFEHKRLLEEALTHPSRVPAGRKRIFNYQRLEFLGDAVLGLVIAEMLFARFPDEMEGDLARRHAALVRSEAIAKVGLALGIGEHIIMAMGEEQGGGRLNQSNIEDVTEALIGAMYLDGGLQPARGFILQHWTPLAESSALPPRDAKTALQEWAQARGLPLPVYAVTHEEGPSHAPIFTIEASVQGHEGATASGPSKRQAEQKAAQMLLERLPE
jgi:ribonuclease-3